MRLPQIKARPLRLRSLLGDLQSDPTLWKVRCERPKKVPERCQQCKKIMEANNHCKQARGDTSPPATTSGPIFCKLSACGWRSIRLKGVKVPPLDHYPTFNAV